MPKAKRNGLFDFLKPRTTIYHVKPRRKVKPSLTSSKIRSLGPAHKIVKVGDHYEVPSLDRGSWFDTREDAQRFIREMKKYPNPGKYADAVTRLTRRAIAVDEAYQKALDAAGEKRYAKHTSATVKAAYKRKVKADEAMHKAIQRMRAAGQSVNPSHRTYKTKGGFRGLKSMMTRRRKPSEVGKAFGTKTRERYLVSLDSSTYGRSYASTFEGAKKKGEALARKRGEKKFYIQNQVTGSIINFEVTEKNPTLALPQNQFVNAKVRLSGGNLQISGDERVLGKAGFKVGASLNPRARSAPSPKATHISRKVRRAMKSGDMSKARYKALQSKYRYRKLHPAVNPGLYDGETIYVQRVRLNRQGYERDGTYWGVGAPLFHYELEKEGRSNHLRADSRSHAREILKAKYPGAKVK